MKKDNNWIYPKLDKAIAEKGRIKLSAEDKMRIHEVLNGKIIWYNELIKRLPNQSVLDYEQDYELIEELHHYFKELDDLGLI